MAVRRAPLAAALLAVSLGRNVALLPLPPASLPPHPLQSNPLQPNPTQPLHQPYGVPYAAWGMAYILLFSFLLPGHDGSGHTDLTSELQVKDK
jgi:hypothetical protein